MRFRYYLNQRNAFANFKYTFTHYVKCGLWIVQYRAFFTLRHGGHIGVYPDNEIVLLREIVQMFLCFGTSISLPWKRYTFINRLFIYFSFVYSFFPICVFIRLFAYLFIYVFFFFIIHWIQVSNKSKYVMSRLQDKTSEVSRKLSILDWVFPNRSKQYFVTVYM